MCVLVDDGWLGPAHIDDPQLHAVNYKGEVGFGHRKLRSVDGTHEA